MSEPDEDQLRTLFRSYRYLAFGYNRFKQKGLRIGCPGGQVCLTREKGGTVRVDLIPDGETMEDHIGEVETEHGGRVRGRVIVRLTNDEVKER